MQQVFTFLLRGLPCTTSKRLGDFLTIPPPRCPQNWGISWPLPPSVQTSYMKAPENRPMIHCLSKSGAKWMESWPKFEIVANITQSKSLTCRKGVLDDLIFDMLLP